MYGKVFDSIYDGTLYGHWEAIVTMQQLIVLANADGVVDMTPQAIAARTSIPLDILTKGLKVLSEPDPYTRTPGEDGRRVVLIDDHRPWGWRLVNHGKYQRLRNMEQKREADRERISEKRNKNKDVAIVSQPVANVAPADAYANADTDAVSPAPAGVAKPSVSPCQHQEIIDLYNEILPMGVEVDKDLWSGARKAALQARWREKPERQNLLWWGKFFHYCSESKFLTGRTIPRQGREPFRITLEWIVTAGNFVKIHEGTYHR